MKNRFLQAKQNKKLIMALPVPNLSKETIRDKSTAATPIGLMCQVPPSVNHQQRLYFMDMHTQFQSSYIISAFWGLCAVFRLFLWKGIGRMFLVNFPSIQFSMKYPENCSQSLTLLFCQLGNLVNILKMAQGKGKGGGLGSKF